MRIHTNELTEGDFYGAVSDANANLADNTGIRPIALESISEHGSRSHARAFEVKLSGDSARNGQYSTTKAATWDQWGEFLAALFRADESVTVPPVYESREHFHWSTAGRYALEGNFEYCRQHKWEPRGEHVTGAYSVFGCSKCDAIRRAGDWAAVSNA